jgi:hypothetical protein
MVKDLWAECTYIAGGTVAAALMVSIAAAFVAAAYVLLAPTVGVLIASVFLGFLALRTYHRQAGDRHGS